MYSYRVAMIPRLAVLNAKHCSEQFCRKLALSFVSRLRRFLGSRNVEMS